MKKIGPCKILQNLFANAYELELPIDIGILPIFNVAYLYSYIVVDEGQTSGSVDIGTVEKV